MQPDPGVNSDECAGVRTPGGPGGQRCGGALAKLPLEPFLGSRRRLRGFPGRPLAGSLLAWGAPPHLFASRAWRPCPAWRGMSAHAECPGGMPHARDVRSRLFCACACFNSFPFAWCMVLARIQSSCPWASLATLWFEQQRGLCSNHLARTHNTSKPQGGVRRVADTSAAASNFLWLCKSQVTLLQGACLSRRIRFVQVA